MFTLNGFVQQALDLDEGELAHRLWASSRWWQAAVWPEDAGPAPAEDPPGPLEGVVPTDFGRFHMVVRGGGWLDDARGCRSAYRFRALRQTEVIGFRVVCEVMEELD